MTEQTITKLKIIAPVDALLEATAKLLVVVPAKSSRPVLSNIQFTVREGILELSGTDSVAGIHYAVPAATVKEEGSGLLNGARFAELLKEFRGAEARISFNPSGGCQFRAKGGNYKVVGDDVRDYPKLPRFEGKKGFDIFGADLVDMIKKTEFAAAPEESRLTINGVLFELKAGRFRLVATDNKRMSINERLIEVSELDDFSVSLPAEFLRATLKVTSKDLASKNSTLGLAGTKVFYRIPGATVYSTILQGTYPPYGEALGLRLGHHIDCNVKELLSTLRRAMLVNSDLAAFNFERNALRLESLSSTVGVGTADMETEFEPPEGAERIRVGFNPSFFKDALEAMTTKRCRFYFHGPRNAGVLKELICGPTIGPDGMDLGEQELVSDQFVYAVMPAMLPRE